jgi:uncharacterized cupredoxin-like copper-binding protein
MVLQRAAVHLSTIIVLALGAALAQGTIHSADYAIRGMSFEGPSTIPAGMTTITVVNESDRDGDTFALISLSGGRTLDDFFTTMGMLFSGELSVVPDWIDFHGGSPIGLDDERSYTIFLSPGTHYLLSIGGDEEGPYAARGLLLPIEVEAPAVDASVTITTRDYEFEIEGTLVAGTQVVRVHNAANQPHEVLMFPLPPGVGLEEMLSAEDEGEMPGHLIQGMWAINPGETVYVTVHLMEGTYGVICFIPDADGPHFMQGMAAEVSVR